MVVKICDYIIVFYYFVAGADSLGFGSMRRIVKHLLKKYKYPPEGQEAALETIMTQCEMWSDNNI